MILTAIATIFVVGALVIWILARAIRDESRKEARRRSHHDTALGKDEATSGHAASTAVAYDTGSGGDIGGGGD